MIYVVMGVSGCGKSTIGSVLSKHLSVPFYDADDFHFACNIEKMSQGIALTDTDRMPWLNLLAEHIGQWQADGGAVLACSALKQTYRDILSSTTEDVVKFIYLKGNKDLLSDRLRDRDPHFMSGTLLTSQLETLEEPTDSITVLLEKPVDIIITEILEEINQ